MSDLTDAAFGTIAGPIKAALDTLESDVANQYADRLAQAALDVKAAEDATLAVQGKLETSEANRAALQAKYDTLQAAYQALVTGQTPPPPPPPPMTKTLFGGNKPIESTGAMSLQAQADVVAKWGKGAAMRQFFGNSTTTVAPRHADIGRLHASWNFPLADSVATLQPKVKAVTANMKAGDIAESRHEGDSKVRNGGYTLDQIVAHKNNFHAALKAVRPDLETSNTCTGWLFNPQSKLDPTPYMAIKADWLGVDFDGVKDSAYFDYTTLFARVIDLAKKAGYKGVIVPEFGWPQATTDPDDSKRAAEMTRHAKALIAAGFASVCLFEAPTDGYPYRTTAKTTAAWKAFTP